MARLSMAMRVMRKAWNLFEPADLLMVLDEELAGLELVWIHHVEQLPPGSVVLLQILPVELLHAMLCLKGQLLLHGRETP